MVYLGFSREDVGRQGHLHYGWAFALNVAAAALALLAAVLIFVADCCDPRRSHHDDDDDGEDDEAVKADQPPPVRWQPVGYNAEPRPGGGWGSSGGGEGPYAGYPPGQRQGVFVTSDHRGGGPPLPDSPPPRDYTAHDPGEFCYPLGNPYTADPTTTTTTTSAAVAQRKLFLPRPSARPVGGSDVGGARRGQGGTGRGTAVVISSSRSWQGGLGVGAGVTPPLPRRSRRHDDEWRMRSAGPAEPAYLPGLEPAYLPGQWDRAVYYPTGPVYPTLPLPPPQAPAPLMELAPFMLPRVVVRGHYEPGYGYPEYVML